jgi:hypothetical protein
VRHTFSVIKAIRTYENKIDPKFFNRKYLRREHDGHFAVVLLGKGKRKRGLRNKNLVTTNGGPIADEVGQWQS